jgi:hypothetical protein
LILDVLPCGVVKRLWRALAWLFGMPASRLRCVMLPGFTWGHLALADQVSQDLSHGDRIAGLRRRGRDAEKARIEGLDFLRDLITLEDEQHFSRVDPLAILLEPFDERAFIHRPTEARYHDVNCHGYS